MADCNPKHGTRCYDKRMSIKAEYHIPITENSKTAVDWLADATSLSRQKIKQAMQKGCVWLEKDVAGQTHVQRLRRAKKILSEGDVLHCYYDEKVLSSEPAAAILVSDLGDYSIWNKPSGMLSQGSRWGDHCTIYRWAEAHLKPERAAFIVHRLDRAANGLMILAHKKQVARQFAKLFRDHQVEKHYRAVVEGDFSSVLAENEIVKTLSQELVDGNVVKCAVSHVRVVAYDAAQNESVLDVNIETGRKHQIRKHLSGIGFPIVADRLYGSQLIEETTGDLQLSAISLKFICPVTGKSRVFEL